MSAWRTEQGQLPIWLGTRFQLSDPSQKGTTCSPPGSPPDGVPEQPSSHPSLLASILFAAERQPFCTTSTPNPKARHSTGSQLGGPSKPHLPHLLNGDASGPTSLELALMKSVSAQAAPCTAVPTSHYTEQTGRRTWGRCHEGLHTYPGSWYCPVISQRLKEILASLRSH